MLVEGHLNEGKGTQRAVPTKGWQVGIPRTDEGPLPGCNSPPPGTMHPQTFPSRLYAHKTDKPLYSEEESSIMSDTDIFGWTNLICQDKLTHVQVGKNKKNKGIKLLLKMTRSKRYCCL
jgi:hypothetical protein